jgi:hypothetical protein
MHNSVKMDVLDKLRLFREKRQSNSTFCTRQLTRFRFKPESESESETWIWNCRADRRGGTQPKNVTGRQKLSQCAKERHSPPKLKFQDGARVFQSIIGTRNTCYFAHNSFSLLKLLLTCLYNLSFKDVLVWETFENYLPIYMALLFIVGVKIEIPKLPRN